MGNTCFHAALSKTHHFKVYAGLAMGSQSAFKRTGYRRGTAEAPGKRDVRLYVHRAPSLPRTKDLCPWQVPFGSDAEVPGHGLTQGTHPRDSDSQQKGDGGYGSGMCPPPQPRSVLSEALSSCHLETLTDLIQ